MCNVCGDIDDYMNDLMCMSDLMIILCDNLVLVLYKDNKIHIKLNQEVFQLNFNTRIDVLGKPCSMRDPDEGSMVEKEQDGYEGWSTVTVFFQIGY